MTSVSAFTDDRAVPVTNSDHIVAIAGIDQVVFRGAVKDLVCGRSKLSI
jgi:hypothetical protein